MKKIISISALLFAVLFVTVIFVSPAFAESEEKEIKFTDVMSDDYFYESVAWAVTNGITKGTSESAFSPKATCTRCQTVTFLWRAASEPEPVETDNPFVDIEESDYYFKAVLWAYEKGITTGTSETTFSPKSTVTRGQFVTFLWRLSGKHESEGTENQFEDVAEGKYYYKAVLWAAENEVTTGLSETEFGPDRGCLRAQIVTLLYRYYEKISYSEGLEYEENSTHDGYVVCGIGSCTDTKVLIPPKYDGKPVTGIRESAFYDCSSLEAVTIPGSATGIGKWAFYGCSALEKIKIPDSVTNIRPEAFLGTAYYNNENNWENGLLYIGHYLIRANNSVSEDYTVKDGTLLLADCSFEKCTSLKSITVPGTVRSIGDWAFSDCTGLRGITVSDGVRKIGVYTFNNCSRLSSISIPASVTKIGEYAYNNCSTSLETIEVSQENPVYYSEGNCLIKTESRELLLGCKNSVIPDSVVRIGYGAFSYCDGLNVISIPDSVTSIGERAFYACRYMTNITIPDSVQTIEECAFYACWALKDVTIPDGVTGIGYATFSYCYDLTSITIPASVTIIDVEAFKTSSHLTDIFFGGTKEQWNNISKGDNWNSATGNYTVHCTDGDISK